jgi:hypothetical protein
MSHLVVVSKSAGVERRQSGPAQLLHTTMLFGHRMVLSNVDFPTELFYAQFTHVLNGNPSRKGDSSFAWACKI